MGSTTEAPPPPLLVFTFLFFRLSCLYIEDSRESPKCDIFVEWLFLHLVYVSSATFWHLYIACEFTWLLDSVHYLALYQNTAFPASDLFLSIRGKERQQLRYLWHKSLLQCPVMSLCHVQPITVAPLTQYLKHGHFVIRSDQPYPETTQDVFVASAAV